MRRRRRLHGYLLCSPPLLFSPVRPNVRNVREGVCAMLSTFFRDKKMNFGKNLVQVPLVAATPAKANFERIVSYYGSLGAFCSIFNHLAWICYFSRATIWLYHTNFVQNDFSLSPPCTPARKTVLFSLKKIGVKKSFFPPFFAFGREKPRRIVRGGFPQREKRDIPLPLFSRVSDAISLTDDEKGGGKSVRLYAKTR